MVKVLGLTAAGALALCALSGCGREADQAARPDAQAQASAQGSGSSASSASYDQASYSSRRPDIEETAPAFGDGKPAWASSRRYSPTDSEQRQFQRNGDAFSAKSTDDYVAKVHAFIDSPPEGVLKAVRANGDTLYYDAKSNVFAVVDKQGAPRTMFKPREGMAYWTQQQQSLADRSGSRRSGRDHQSSSDDANG